MKNLLHRIIVVSLFLPICMMFSLGAKKRKIIRPIKITTNMPLGEKIKAYNKNFRMGHIVDFEDALEVADDGFLNENLHSKTLKLYKHLVNAGVAFEEAIAAVEKTLASPDSKVRSNARKLLYALVDQGQAFTQAIKIAALDMASQKIDRRLYALELYAKLVQQGNAFEEAQSAANNALDSTDEDLRESAINLYRALVLQEYAQAEALLAVERALHDESDDVKDAAELLIEDLVFLGVYSPIDQDLDKEYLKKM